MTRRVSLCLFLLAVFLDLPARAQEKSTADLAAEAYAVLKNRCYRCHGGSAENAGLNVLSRESLLRQRGQGDAKLQFVVPGKPDDSGLWQVTEGDDAYMPLDGSPEAEAMTAAERGVLQEWIAAGAPFPQREVRRFVSEADLLQAVRDDLFGAPAEDRRYLRYYSLTHLHNNPAVTAFDLRLYRAALAKAINSLTWEREPALPQVVEGTEETVFQIDLRELGWDQRSLWGEILKHYPYGLKYDFADDSQLKQLGQDVVLLSGADLPILRADWFIVTATQPPLYHTLLDIPNHLSVLEQRLGVDFREAFERGTLARAAFAKSGVSQQHRLIERHNARNTPYYWISYDFKPRKAKSDLIRFPLGPPFRGNPFLKFAFEHDGGEIIFSLPNGMQGYMLVDNQGKRIDRGPIDVVYDRAAILGTPEIISGISCMNCHRHGMISEFRDEVRDSNALGGRVREKIQELYPPHEKLAAATARDRRRFLSALEIVIGPYLQVGEDADQPIESFPEPIGRVAEMYSRDLGPTEVALELGLPEARQLQQVIKNNGELLGLGLGTLIQTEPGTLKRAQWETIDGRSFYHDVAVEVLPGVMPVIRLDAHNTGH